MHTAGFRAEWETLCIRTHSKAEGFLPKCTRRVLRFGELGVEIEPRVKLVGLEQVPSQREGRRLENVSELLKCLKENTELF